MQRNPPAWAWMFFALCFALFSVARVVTGDGAFAVGLIGAAIGAAGAGGCLAIAADRSVPTRTRVIRCAGATAVAYALFGALMLTRSDPLAQQAWIGAFAGFVVSIVPAGLYGRKKRARPATVSVIAGAVSGAIAGLLLAVPVAIGFSIAALRAKRVEVSAPG